MFSYAQIDTNTGICYCVSHLSGEVNADNLIALDGDMNVLGKRWNGSTWEEVEKVEEETTDTQSQEATNTELLAKLQKLEKSLLDIMDGQATIFEMQLAVSEGT